MQQYNSYPDYLRHLFGERIQKLSINAGFTCPNRDGTCGIDGCSYCNALAFNPSYCNPKMSIKQQIYEGKHFHQIRDRKTSKYLAYFQTFSNTYSNIQHLKEIYTEALSFPDVVGIVIGTRPDCIDNEKLDYLQELSEKYYVKIEYGIESTYDDTLKNINRGHNYQTTVNSLISTSKRNIHTGGHIIFGLPGETNEMIQNEANKISQLPLETLKIHQLQIMNETLMAKEYNAHPENFHLFELDEYIQIVATFIEHLRPDIVIERIASEVPPKFLFTQSKWGLLRYDIVLSKFEKYLEEHNIRQGDKYNINS